MGEGGGQILRSALALSLVTGTPFELRAIRARRARPGLRPQHLAAVKAAAAIGRADVRGAELGSSRLSFAPGRPQGGRYAFDIGTAGATGLVLQTVYLPLLLAGCPSEVTVTGGTHVPQSPCFHYLDEAWRVLLAALGARLALTLERAGFYPRGGGRIAARIEPAGRLERLELVRRGPLLGIHGLSAVARLDRRIAERQRDRARERLASAGLEASIELSALDAGSPGTVLMLAAELERSRACYFALGERGKPAERVADEAVDQLLAFLASGASVDRYAADQLLLPLALAAGRSCLRTEAVTRHLTTNAAVVRAFLPAVEIAIEGAEGAPGTVHVRP